MHPFMLPSMLKLPSISILLIFLSVLLHGFFFIPTIGEQHPKAMRLELVHRHSHKLGENRPTGGAKTRLESIKELVQSDALRHDLISHRRGRSLVSKDKVFEPLEGGGNGGGRVAEMPIRSAIDYGVAAYHVRFRVGTPGEHFMLAADTGSDLTWVKCRYHCDENNCRIDTRDSTRKRVFDADHSSSFRTIPCSEKMCQDDLFNYWALTSICPTPWAPCRYNYSYLDNSFAVGIFGMETVSARLGNGRLRRLRNVLIGCTESPSGFEAVDGVMGLGFSKYSFTNKAINRFDGKFSYCLVDHLSSKNVSSYLSFGDNEHEKSNLGKIQVTQLMVGVITPYYMINIIGISVGDVMLNIPRDVWDVNRGGGTIIDSATSLTTLAPPAYKLVMAALEVSLRSFKKAEVDAPFEFCFKSAGFNEFSTPRLKFHFADGAHFEPPVKSYILDADKGVKCIGITPGSWPGVSIIGNIMQQNYFWEFDLRKNTLGFAPSSCT